MVAIGEAAAEVAAAFDGRRPGARAASMDDAVAAAAALARPGDAVLLSPGCASFDWYGSYAERGDDFARAVASAALGDAQRAVTHADAAPAAPTDDAGPSRRAAPDRRCPVPAPRPCPPLRLAARRRSPSLNLSAW